MSYQTQKQSNVILSQPLQDTFSHGGMPLPLRALVSGKLVGEVQ